MDRRFRLRLEELLEDALVPPELFDELRPRLEEFLQPFAAALVGEASRRHAAEYIGGLLSNLPAKTAEAAATAPAKTAEAAATAPAETAEPAARRTEAWAKLVADPGPEAGRGAWRGVEQDAVVVEDDVDRLQPRGRLRPREGGAHRRLR